MEDKSPQKIASSQELNLKYYQKELGHFVFHYSIDNKHGLLSLQIPLLNKPHFSLETLLATSVGIFIAQLYLPRKRIVFDFPISKKVLPLIRSLCKMLYDVRAYRDSIDLIPLPKIIVNDKRLQTVDKPLNKKKAVLLWGGGKDSTYSHLLLQSNNYQILPVHSNINYKSAETELNATQKLANQLKTNLQIIKFYFPDMIKVGQQYSNVFDKYPSHNAIPHGRDLILTIASALLAIENDAGYVCFGHEADLWNKKILYKGTFIHRHDMQSEYANVLLQQIFEELIPNLKIFSPISPLTEFSILANLLLYHPEIVTKISSCFWGEWCGECSKCLRYHLIQLVINKHTFHFKKNPLSDENKILWDCALNLQNPDMPYRDEILYCLTKVSKKDDPSWDKIKQFFLNEIIPTLSDEPSEIFKRLTTRYPSQLIPLQFSYSLVRGISVS